MLAYVALCLAVPVYSFASASTSIDKRCILHNIQSCLLIPLHIFAGIFIFWFISLQSVSQMKN